MVVPKHHKQRNKAGLHPSASGWLCTGTWHELRKGSHMLITIRSPRSLPPRIAVVTSTWTCWMNSPAPPKQTVDPGFYVFLHLFTRPFSRSKPLHHFRSKLSSCGMNSRTGSCHVTTLIARGFRWLGMNSWRPKIQAGLCQDFWGLDGVQAAGCAGCAVIQWSLRAVVSVQWSSSVIRWVSGNR